MLTKLDPAPLKYPNGGGISAMATKPKSQSLELEAMEAKHAAEIQKLKEKHAASNKTKPVINKGKKNG